MTFAYPEFFWLLVVVPPSLLAFLWWAARKRQRLLARFIQVRLLPELTVGHSARLERTRLWLLIGGVVALILALARPQWGFTWEEARQKGLNVIIAIDTSKSMLAEDVAPNRLARAKLAAIDLMQIAKSDRLGLVAFAGGAFLQCPMTIDDAAFRQSVDMLDVNTLPQGGTAIAEAITTAQAAFKHEDGYKVLVLFTDGEDHDSNAVEAARRAAEQGLRIYTIGIGSTEGEILPSSIRDPDGNVVKSRLNEKMLQEVATAGGGFYLPLRGAKVMETLYESKNGLASLPKSESEAKLYKRYHEHYHWPLALGIVLLLMETLLPERGREKRRNAAVATTPGHAIRGVKAPAVAALALLLWQPLGHASPSSAMKEFREGRYPEAQQEYEHLASIDKKGDLRLAFNAGTAAYRTTNYDAAIRHFSAAVMAQDVKLQQAAYFNLGNCLFRQGQDAKDLDEMQEKWEMAAKYFQNAVTLDQNDQDAAHNLAFTRRCVEQLIALREAAQRAKEAADAAARRRNYHQALEIMQQLLQTNPAAKQFEDFVGRLKNIDDIATP
jgi:Ca-activated chloride channel family protein